MFLAKRAVWSRTASFPGAMNLLKKVAPGADKKLLLRLRAFFVNQEIRIDADFLFCGFDSNIGDQAAYVQERRCLLSLCISESASRQAIDDLISRVPPSNEVGWNEKL